LPVNTFETVQYTEKHECRDSRDNKDPGVKSYEVLIGFNKTGQ